MKLDEVLIKIGVESTQVKMVNTLVTGINNSANELGKSAVLINSHLNATFINIATSIEKAGTQSAKASSVLKQLKQGIVNVVKVVSQAASVFDESIGQTESLAKNKHALFKISKDEVALSQSYTKALDKSQIAINSVKNKIALGLAPTIVKLVSGFNDWLQTNKSLIQNGINHLVTALNKVIQVFVNTARFIDIIISNTLGWQNALTILGTAWAVFNRQLLFSPLGIVAAAIAGLMLLIDDFMVYMNGGDSLFGGFWGKCVEWIQKVKSIWNGLSNGMKEGLGHILSLLTVLSSAQFFMSVLSGGKIFTSLIQSLIGTATFLNNVMGLLSKAVLFLGRTFLMNPIGLIITLVAGLIYVLFDLYKWVTTGESAFGGFWQMFVDGWKYVKGLFSQVIDWIVLKWNSFIEFCSNLCALIGQSIASAINFIIAPFIVALDIIKSVFSGIVDWAITKWNELIASCSSLCQSIGSIFTSVIDLISQPFTAAFDLIKALFGIGCDDSTSYIDNLTKAFSNVTDIITKPFANAKAWIKDKFVGYINGVTKTLKGALSFFGLGDSSDDNQEIANNLSAEQVSNTARQGTMSKISNTAHTVNQGDVTNNITIHSSDTQTSARETAGIYQTQLVDAYNNFNSSVGVA